LYFRAKEMLELRRLREDTERERAEKDVAKKDKNDAMKKRLKKIRDKKRQKMGLPPVRKLFSYVKFSLELVEKAFLLIPL